MGLRTALVFNFLADASPCLRGYVYEGARDVGVELLTRAAQDFSACSVNAGSLAITAVRGHCVECVGECEDTGAERNVIFAKAVRISAAVKLLMMMSDDQRRRA